MRDFVETLFCVHFVLSSIVDCDLERKFRHDIDYLAAPMAIPVSGPNSVVGDKMSYVIDLKEAVSSSFHESSAGCVRSSGEPKGISAVIDYFDSFIK